MTPYYSDAHVTLYHADMRELLPELGLVDAVVTDPPYGETSLEWDRWPDGWPALVATVTNSLWCFGSLRMLTTRWAEFAGWKLAQEIVWEKQNGSGLATDRFKRVHEFAVHFYRGQWTEIHKVTPRQHVGDVRPDRQRNAFRGPHLGPIPGKPYIDDGYRLMRSVIRAPNMNHRAIHPTEKPAAILDPLIRYSVPVGGTVLDPFAGSASTLLTARTLGRRAVGIEAHEPYCEAAAKRLSTPDLFGGAA